jgi:hypothetical protein
VHTPKTNVATDDFTEQLDSALAWTRSQVGIAASLELLASFKGGFSSAIL